MYMNKQSLKEIASLINSIDTYEISMDQNQKKQDWESCRRNRYARNLVIIELTEKFKIPHVLYNNAVEQNRNIDEAEKGA